MKYIYTPEEAANEVVDMYKKHPKMNMMRNNKRQKGEISTRSLVELAARDEKDLRGLLLSFFYPKT